MSATLRHGLRAIRAGSLASPSPAHLAAQALRLRPPTLAASFATPFPAGWTQASRLMVCSRGMCTPADAPRPKKPHSWSRPPGAKAPSQAPNQPQGQVTPLQGENLPADPWTAVTDPKTGSTYYWNQLTNETTAIGEPKPDGMYRQGQQQQVYEYQPQTMLGSLGGMFLWGMGITFGFAIVGALFRMLFG